MWKQLFDFFKDLLKPVQLKKWTNMTTLEGKPSHVRNAFFLTI